MGPRRRRGYARPAANERAIEITVLGGCRSQMAVFDSNQQPFGGETVGGFVAIDFETANEQRSSPCSVAMVRVDRNRVVQSWSTLIDPEQPFAAMNVSIHGIRPEDVQGAPTFPEVLPRILETVRTADVLVAHSAAFDVQVLTGTALRYEQNMGAIFPFACTWVFSRRWWPGWPSYSLGHVVDRLALADDLEGAGHHDALWDATASAHIALRGLQQGGASDFNDAAAQAGVRLGSCGGPAYRGCVSSSGGGSKIDPTRDPDAKINPERPLYGLTLCFTGALEQFPRREAAQQVADAGGQFSTNVTTQVDLLVVGRQDLHMLNGAQISSKMRKASKMAADGHPIEIISEADFYRMLTT
ncbi:MAG: exonuclease domain-containing protein [Nitriliruptoraceae bacterium]